MHVTLKMSTDEPFDVTAAGASALVVAMMTELVVYLHKKGVIDQVAFGKELQQAAEEREASADGDPSSLPMVCGYLDALGTALEASARIPAAGQSGS